MVRNQNERLNALPSLEGKGQAYNTKQADNRAANPGPSAEPTPKNLSFEHRSAVAHDPLGVIKINIMQLYLYVAILSFILNCSCNNKESKEMSNKSKNDKALEKDYLQLRDYFGHENIRLDVQQEIVDDNNNDSLFIEESKIKYIKVRVTHIPTGKVAFGRSYDNQMENTIEALKKLKEEIKNTNAQH